MSTATAAATVPLLGYLWYIRDPEAKSADARFTLDPNDNPLVMAFEKDKPLRKPTAKDWKGGKGSGNLVALVQSATGETLRVTLRKNAYMPDAPANVRRVPVPIGVPVVEHGAAADAAAAPGVVTVDALVAACGGDADILASGLASHFGGAFATAKGKPTRAATEKAKALLAK